ncbi:PREDICTED: alpha-mannosidase 2 [Nicrophorus vespilloides]|uniref:Alpha-mannosidase n=1 Tax=Nicrophorus vespilloides TaxID=110193 RepID=A0ABM1M7U6_NICVS|nr:PREDICTED: alpha-mannosidase 2 [Nicrophorus vespilloides]
MAVKAFRRISPKAFALSAIFLTVLLCIYYASNSNESRLDARSQEAAALVGEGVGKEESRSEDGSKRKTSRQFETCPTLAPAEVDVNTVDVFKDFEFQPTWMKMKEYWDKPFEDRFERQKMDPERPPLKVIIVPHSHNDPGWLKTFENYFHYQSRPIMNNMVMKLQQHKNLTFIWSEIAFLNAWWEVAHPSKQRALKALVNSGRLEITTGGWVMTDEANAHMYAMIDQLIEGHQWVLTNLGIKPRSGWSIDPFGHGSTQPYLLAASGVKGTIIQRIHYAWKQWLALKQYGDFKWVPNWGGNSGTILTHNQPFDIYSIKHSCGPHPYVCLNFDFRKVPGEYTEYSVKAQAITEKNVKEKSELLLEQYSRTGSLFPHNVVLMPLGDDFRYNVAEEWDQQYTNYMKLVNYVNANKETYKTEIVFGTPKDYFDAILERYDQFPTLRGDFFVYSDIFSEGRPAYWSGYFTTRPFMKILDRELENSLRASEILYTIAINSARQKNILPYLKILERDYEKLVMARRNLGLFQHHDAITGTSKSFVMRDYGLKLFESLRDTVKIQQNALQSLMLTNPIKSERNVVLSDLERDSYEKLPKKTIIVLETGKSRKIILFNSQTERQDQYIQLRVNSPDVRVLNSNNEEIQIQINPVWNYTDNRLFISPDEYELVFVASLPPLSIATYNITYKVSEDQLAMIYCNRCHRKPNDENFQSSKFIIKNTQTGDVQLENQKFRILFNGNTGFMKSITRKATRKTTQCAIQFAAYRSAQFHSGAYLFMPDPNEREIEKDVLQQYKDQLSIIITSGSVSSEITVIYGPFLTHTVRIYHLDSPISDGIYVENVVDFENPPKNRETELFMRLVTEIQNGEPPEFYTDSNGFSMQKRTKVEKIGIEGNYFPITTMAYIQDDAMRISLLTNHAQGAASWQPGFLEVMLDRRTLYDDSRGMGEGVVDNRKTTHKFWMLLEDVSPSKLKKENTRFENTEYGDTLRTFNGNEPMKIESYSRPSLFANHQSNNLNYPFSAFILEEGIEIREDVINLINAEFPCDFHLVTLRTQPDPVYTQFPSNSALLVMHRQGYMCSVNHNYTCQVSSLKSGANFNMVRVKSITPTTLTGTETTGDSIKDFSDINISTMALQTYNITFN